MCYVWTWCREMRDGRPLVEGFNARAVQYSWPHQLIAMSCCKCSKQLVNIKENLKQGKQDIVRCWHWECRERQYLPRPATQCTAMLDSSPGFANCSWVSSSHRVKTSSVGGDPSGKNISYKKQQTQVPSGLHCRCCSDAYSDSRKAGISCMLQHLGRKWVRCWSLTTGLVWHQPMTGDTLKKINVEQSSCEKWFAEFSVTARTSERQKCTSTRIPASRSGWIS